VNALILGKVILIGEVLHVGKLLERRALVWVMLSKSLMFTILLLAFHIAEEAMRAWFVGQPLSASLADLGGSLSSLVAGSSQVIVHNMKDARGLARAEELGIRSVPAVVIDGRLASNAGGGVDIQALKSELGRTP